MARNCSGRFTCGAEVWDLFGTFSYHSVQIAFVRCTRVHCSVFSFITRILCTEKEMCMTPSVLRYM